MTGQVQQNAAGDMRVSPRLNSLNPSLTKRDRGFEGQGVERLYLEVRRHGT
jgi:hypothetical protein